MGSCMQPQRVKHKNALPQPPAGASYFLEIERVINREEHQPTVDSFTCQICLCLTINPYIDRSSCQNAYCFKCIEDYWNKAGNRSCPLRCKDPKFTPINRIEKLPLQALKLSCKNAAYDCKEILTYENFAAHEAACNFQAIKCQSPQCDITLAKSKMVLHERECQHINEKCEKCEQMISKKEKAAHDCNKFLLERIQDKSKLLDDAERELEKYKKRASELKLETEAHKKKLEETEKKAANAKESLKVADIIINQIIADKAGETVEFLPHQPGEFTQRIIAEMEEDSKSHRGEEDVPLHTEQEKQEEKEEIQEEEELNESHAELKESMIILQIKEHYGFEEEEIIDESIESENPENTSINIKTLTSSKRLLE